MIAVRYLLTVSLGGEEFDYTHSGSLPVIPQDFDGTNSLEIDDLKFFISDLELKNGDPLVTARVQLYGEDMPDDKTLPLLIEKGWTRVEETP